MSKCVIEYGHRNLEIVEPTSSYNDLDLHLCDPNSDKSIGTHESNQSIHISSEISILKQSKSTERTESDNSISSLDDSSEAVKLEDKAILKIDLN